MGFERLVSAIQDRRSNYDTDIFLPIFDKVRELTGVRPYEGRFGADDVDGIDTAYRVVADHVRTLTFALSDGGVPNNVGRGYVLRRILRRGARYARKKLGVNIGSFFSSLVPVVIENMVGIAPLLFHTSVLIHTISKGDAFPEITKKFDEIKEILDEEEESFSRTLDRGERLFDQFATRAKERGVVELNGKDVWRLYDTFGFPVDLTRLMAEELGLTINDKEFEEAQAHSREASKASLKKGATNLVKLEVHDLDALAKNDDVQKTDDSAKFSEFSIIIFSSFQLPKKTQSEPGTVNSVVKAIFYDKAFFQTTKDIPEDATFGLILDKTCFYAEAGGQEYDTGNIVIDGVADFEVVNVQAYNGYVLHTGHLKYGALSLGTQVVASYDEVSPRITESFFY